MEFMLNFLGAILGTGVGGTIIYFAGQKFIENTTKQQFENVNERLQVLEDSKVSVKIFEEYKTENREKFQDFKDDYVPLKVYETSQKYVNEGIKEIKEMIRCLSEKIDKVR